MKSKKKSKKTRPSKYSNLAVKKQKAIQELQSRNDTVISDTNKGGAVVILDVDWVKKAERQLNNKENCRKINCDPTTANNETIHKVILRFEKEDLLSKHISEVLKTEKPKTPHFYLRPKVHKKGNPGRSVTSSINCHTSKIPKYVDYHFQPIVKEIPSCVQDTIDFLTKINQIDFVPNNSYLVSLDVKSLPTNISNAAGIKSVKTPFEKYSKWTASTKVITTFFNTNTKQLYFQLQKLLTDKRLDHEKICALSYANIFVNHFERKLMYSFIKTFSCSYLRFIEDIFFIWTGSKTDLENFLNEFNTKHPSIKVEYKISK